jgi:hypothetical protein
LRGCEQPSKTPPGYRKQGEFGPAPELALNIRNQDHYSRREAKSDSREENALSPRGYRDGNWESDERDIRDKN